MIAIICAGCEQILVHLIDGVNASLTLSRNSSVTVRRVLLARERWAESKYLSAKQRLKNEMENVYFELPKYFYCRSVFIF